jgi:branched-chain amino acid transport system permease protein
MNELIHKIPLLLMVVVLVALGLPSFAGEYVIHIGVLILFYAYMAVAWNILGGYAGQHSLGHALFMGIGAYTSTYFFTVLGITPWIGMWVGCLLAGLVGWFIGFMCFRYGLKGPYFCLVTIALAEAAVYLVTNLDFLGGSQGMEVTWTGNAPRMMQFNGKTAYYYIILVMLAAAVMLSARIIKRRFGYQMVAVRENEDAAEALGVDTLKVKIQATVISAMLTALGGTFFAQYFTYINPRAVLGEDPSIQILLFAIIGGTGTVWGPVVGALVLVPMAEYFRSTLGESHTGGHILLYGVLMVLVILFMPNGILGLYNKVRGQILHAGLREKKGGAV